MTAPCYAADARILARLRCWTLALCVLAWLLALTLLFPPSPRLLWNASASAPEGLYSVAPGASFARGDMLAARLPKAEAWLAAERRYLPENVPLVKRVAAVGGDQVCATRYRISVNGHPVATRLAADRQGRWLPYWLGCRTVEPGGAFLLMEDVPASFDGRYFGLTGRDAIIGKAVLLWRR